jgi:hypothetical protein
MAARNDPGSVGLIDRGIRIEDRFGLIHHPANLHSKNARAFACRAGEGH